jgi:hypothetical protein
VGAHQHRRTAAERLRKASSLRQIAHKHISIAEIVADISDRHLGAHAARRVDDLPHR